MAVLTPILGGTDWSQDFPDGVKSAFRQLRSVWHDRLQGLLEANWKPTQDHDGYQFMRNCPPFGVDTKQKTGACGRHRLCPFCFARRYVLVGFRFLENVLYGGTDPDAKPRTDLRLIEFKKSIRTADYKKEDWGPTTTVFRALADIVKQIRLNRRKEVDAWEAEYGVVFHKVEPTGRHFLITRSGFLLGATSKPDALYDRLFSGNQSAYTIHKAANKRTLAEACGRVFTYPVRLLHAEPTMAVTVLEALKRVRLMTRYWGNGGKP